jgi:hypothetical protein
MQQSQVIFALHYHSQELFDFLLQLKQFLDSLQKLAQSEHLDVIRGESRRRSFDNKRVMGKCLIPLEKILVLHHLIVH